MATREGIREGIAKDIYTDWSIGSVSWEKTLPAEKTPWLKTADKVMITEDSQGVVIKVDSQLFDNGIEDKSTGKRYTKVDGKWVHVQEPKLVAVELLVEGE